MKLTAVSRTTATHASTSRQGAAAAEPHWDARLAPLYGAGWRDIQHAEIVLPRPYEGDRGMLWAKNRARLWTVAEYSENKAGAHIAQGFVEQLPQSLTSAQQLALTRGFAQALADRQGTAVDFAIHRPHSMRDEAHVHLFSTTREIAREGFGALKLTGSRQERKEQHRLWNTHVARAAQAALVEAQLNADQASLSQARESTVTGRSPSRQAVHDSGR